LLLSKTYTDFFALEELKSITILRRARESDRLRPPLATCLWHDAHCVLTHSFHASPIVRIASRTMVVCVKGVGQFLSSNQGGGKNPGPNPLYAEEDVIQEIEQEYDPLSAWVCCETDPSSAIFFCLLPVDTEAEMDYI
jgi:hypothetical protein